MDPRQPVPDRKLKIAVLLGAEPYQAFHVADIAFHLAEQPGLEVEFVATLPQSLETLEGLARSAADAAIPRRLLVTPRPLRLLQKLAIFGPLKIQVMRSKTNRALLSSFDAIVTPTDHVRFVRPDLDPLPAMIYVNHGIGGRAASYSDKYLGFDFVVVASRNDEKRLLRDRLIQPGRHVVAYPKFQTARRIAAQRAPLFANDLPVVLFNSHSKRSLRSWEAFARPLIDHAATTGAFNLIVAPHVKLFGRKPRFVWRRWQRLATASNVLVDLGSSRSLDMSYTMAADIYVGDVSSQLSEYLTRPKPCVFLNPHRLHWRGNEDFASWQLGDVVETPAQAFEAIRLAPSHHPLYEARQRERIEQAVDRSPTAANDAANSIARFLQARAARAGEPGDGKVMFLVSDLGTGGTARATMLTANGFAERQVETSLVVMRRGGVLEDALDRRVKFLSLDRRSARGLGMLLGVRELAKLIRAERPTRLVSAGNHMHVMASLAHGLARVPSCELVLKMTNPIERPARPIANYVRRGFYRWAFGRAARILVIAPPTLPELAASCPAAATKLIAVDNPYVTDAMLAAGEDREGPHQGRLLAIGRLVPQKDYPLLLRALARISDRPWTLDILGDGPLLGALREQARSLGIGDRVNFRGFVSDPLPFLKLAHALVLSSAWEGQGAVLLEALACNCPVIAVRSTDAVAAVVDDGKYGRLVPPGDADALARAIADELGEPSRVPAGTREWVARYRLDSGVQSHLQALGIATMPPEAAPATTPASA